MPLGPYKDFDDCVRKNKDKRNPEAYCGSLERDINPASTDDGTVPRVRFQIVPIIDDQFVAGGDPAIIVDIDGTLLGRDNTPIEGRVEAVNALPGRMFVVTGRLEADRESTANALSEAGLRSHTLIMRKDENQHVPAFKRAEAERLLETYDVTTAVDNDPDARREYKDLGIEAMSPGDMKGAASMTSTTSNTLSNVSIEIEIEDDEMMPEAEMPEEGAPMEGEEFHTMLVVEGVWTGDGRYIEEGALGWRDLPLPLMATDRTTEGHMNAVLIGNLGRIERKGRELHAYGTFVQTDDPEVMRLQNLVRKGELRGVSVDLDAMQYEVVVPPMPEMPVEEVDNEGNTVVPIEDMKIRVTSARIMGATVVPFPAFQEAFIESIAALTASTMILDTVTGWMQTFASYDDIDFTPPQAARDEAERGLAWRDEHGRGGTEVGVARARDIKNGKALSPTTINRMVSYFARHEVDKQGQGWSTGEDGYPSAGRIAWALWGGDPGMAWANKVKKQMESRDKRGSIVASGEMPASPVIPPASWFTNPNLTAPTPMTVDDDGHVYGHLAVWGTCHVGFADRCVEPPASITNYAHFLTGEIILDDNTRKPVGQITLNGNHAPHSANASQTAAHYDNTATAVVDVTIGEDEYGIWVTGALRPGLDPVIVRTLMASDVSGDWRRIGGNLELVAILAVNVPGFPKIRVKEAEGLVASLSLPAFNGLPTDLTVDLIAERIGRSKQTRIAELSRRVNRDRVQALVARVKGA